MTKASAPRVLTGFTDHPDIQGAPGKGAFMASYATSVLHEARTEVTPGHFETLVIPTPTDDVTLFPYQDSAEREAIRQRLSAEFSDNLKHAGAPADGGKE